ncbi:MAG: ribosomal L7Ae/L30e/S12e/Gadd45 family protein [Candidatus Caldarchaeum sp.]|nr:ribosomal L7Ae/L30e/S12e/Gadd45 family protein [Candidatus Caldarchaeum sp.]
MDLKQSLEVVSRTGKLVVGYRRTLKLVAEKKPVLVVASRRSSSKLLKTITVMASAAGVPLILSDLSPAELGLSLRKPLPTSFISVLDPGSSDLAERVRSESGE